MNTMHTAALVLMTIATSGPASALLPPEGVADQRWQEIRLEKYQLEKKSLGNQGYDPVAYFPEGDPKGKGRAKKGSKRITHEHRGVTYRFSSVANRDLFKRAPEKYEPAYGGWCAYAIGHETYTEPNPKNFRVQGGRLLLFYDSVFTDTAKSWEKEGAAKLEALADDFWRKETGERPPVKTGRAKP